jgi:Domain of unknown function (DUF4351)
MFGLRLEETRFYQEAKADGKLEGARSLILRLLARRVGNISPDLQAQIQALSLPQVEALGEALLDFQNILIWFSGCKTIQGKSNADDRSSSRLSFGGDLPSNGQFFFGGDG